MQQSSEHLTVLKEALKRVTPTDEETTKAWKVISKVLSRLKPFEKKYRFKSQLLGSFARDSWLPGKLDIDIFLIFDRSVKKEDLERIGIDVGVKVSDGKYQLRYASHPYVRVIIDSYKIDLVPCYRIKRNEKIISAVDRTPLHNAYLISRGIKKLSDEVRLLKSFLRGINAYGAEAHIEGFSGYLTEL